MARAPSITAKLVCAYCGVAPGTTDDHAVPRCLFPTPPPQNLVTVPACSPCNAAKAADDTFLRDFLTADAAGHEHPVAANLFAGKVRRSVARNQSELARLVQEATLVEAPLLTPLAYSSGSATASHCRKAASARFSSVS